MHVFSNDPPDKATDATNIVSCPPSPQNYTVTVLISGSDCRALSDCNLEVVLYRGSWFPPASPTWQAIDRKNYVYGTSSYQFSVTVDPLTYNYIGARIQDQPGPPCGFSYNQSGFTYSDIQTNYPSGGSFNLVLYPCN